MRHDKHRDALRSVPVSVATAALAASTSSVSCAAIPTTAVTVSSSACRDVADNAFRLLLDASPDGLPLLVRQRVPRCE